MTIPAHRGQQIKPQRKRKQLQIYVARPDGRPIKRAWLGALCKITNQRDYQLNLSSF